MAIDTDDIKILVHSSFQLLMKSCWQCLKDRPFISVFLLVFLSFYIFAPSLFNLLFYSSPLVICTAILLQGQFQFRHQNITTDKPGDENDKATMKRSPRESDAPSRKLRPTIQAAMSRRTFKKRTCEELGTILMEDLKVDFIIRSFSDDIPMKLREEKVSIGSDDSVSLSSGCKKNAEAEKPSDAVKIDAESQKDDKMEARLPQEKEKSKPVVEWTEEDQRNHMDLGSSDMERNKRLENLIAKRRARKVFSMQPYRNPLNAVASDFQGLVTPINTERNSSDSEGGQPGSAPSVLGPTNPFDLPYDPSEEKPVLTGDGFAEEILITQPKDMHYCRHESFTYGPSFFTDHYDDPHSASRFSVFTNPVASICPGLPRSRRHSDAGGSLKHVSEQSSQECENVGQIHEGLSNEVQLENTQSNRPEEVNIPAQNLPASHEENVSPNREDADTMLLEFRDTEQEERQSNTLAMESTEMNQQDLIEDDNDETSSVSSFEATADVASASADVAVAVKNETFRNSVKKVLDVIQKNRDIPSPRFAHPTKMEERSFYTRPSHHLSYSITSDMQVEVSDEPNSPTDVESLVFHRDEDDTDESSQGTSRGSVELEESTTRSNAQLFVDYPTSGQADEENLNNSDDFNVESSHAEDDMVQTTNMLPVDDQDIEFGSIQSPGDSATSPTTQFPQQDNHHTINVVPMMMVGSASTSTEQNIDSYIHSPSNNDPQIQIQIQDPNVQHPISPSDLDPISPSINIAESAPSPKSVLPETIPVHELASSWECGSSLSQDSGHAMVHTTTHDSDDMALMSSADSMHSHVEPFDGPPVSTTSLHDLPSMEDEVCLGATTPLKKDSGEETSKLRD